MPKRARGDFFFFIKNVLNFGLFLTQSYCMALEFLEYHRVGYVILVDRICAALKNLVVDSPSPHSVSLNEWKREYSLETLLVCSIDVRKSYRFDMRVNKQL